jgi:hypothetical protein
MPKRHIRGEESGTMVKIAFLYIGGLHQVFHTAAVAAEMSRQDDYDVHCLYATEDTLTLFDEITTAFEAGPIRRTRLELSRIWKPVLQTLNIPQAHKLLRLHAMRHLLSEFDAIVTPERTSAVLRNWVAPSTKLIHFKHGAGDGQKGFEDRLRAFDLVVVSGEKDKQRLYDENLVSRGNCIVAGSVKIATVERLGTSRKSLFANTRQTVLYNPHFNDKLGSWQNWGPRIVEQFARQSEFNLVVAPHIRMFERASLAERAAFESLAVPGRVIIDAGSRLSCDMTYTNSCDIYVGDVSSQSYEFFSQPRPCVFLNSHSLDWHDDRNYAFWHYGDVVDDVDEVIGAVQRATAIWARSYEKLQRNAVAHALGQNYRDAPARAAEKLSAYIAPQIDIRELVWEATGTGRKVDYAQ